MLRLGTSFQFAKLFCLLVTLSEAHVIAMVEPRIYCAMCVTREDLNKTAHWPESFIAGFCSEYYWTLHIMHRPDHPKSFYEWKTGSIVIVLSSVLFGYGTFICINTIDIIL